MSPGSTLTLSHINLYILFNQKIMEPVEQIKIDRSLLSKVIRGLRQRMETTPYPNESLVTDDPSLSPQQILANLERIQKAGCFRDGRDQQLYEIFVEGSREYVE